MVTEKTGDGENSGDGNSSEGNGNGCDSQNGDGDNDDGDEESQHSGLGQCSTPSSQKEPPRKTRCLRQKKYRQRTPERRGLQSPSHLAKVQSRGKERIIASFRDSSRSGRNILALA